MAVTIDRPNYEILVPRADMTLVQSTPVEIRQLDTNAFRLLLRDLDDDENGRPWPVTHDHNTDVVIGGINYARQIIIREPYTITFEDGLYVVQILGSNNNVLDRTNKNQVSVASNNSAGLISSAEIEYASYNGGVTIDVSNKTGKAVAGTVYNIGTPAKPSNNLADTHLIADHPKRGFDTVFVKGDLEIGTEASWEGHSFIGESAGKSNIHILEAANVLDLEIYEAKVSGTLDGNSQIEKCVVDGLDFVDGHMYLCGIGALGIKLGTSTQANVLSCYSLVPGELTPAFDMNGTGVMKMEDYKGGAKFFNYSGDGSHTIGIAVGQAILDSTITGGTWVFRGDSKVVDENGVVIPTGTWNGGVTIKNETTSYLMSLIPDAVWTTLLSAYKIEGTAGHILEMTGYLKKSVYVDPELVTNGDGSSGKPYNNIGDAIDFAEGHSLRDIIALTEITLDRNLKNFIITGIGAPVINCGGFDLKGSEFTHCTMRGTYVDRIVVQESVLDNGFSLNGFFENCAINGDLTCVDGGAVLLKNCAGLTAHNISMNGAGSSTLKISRHSGEVTITDANNVADDLYIGMGDGTINLAASCTAGTVVLAGIAKLVNNSSLSNLDVTALTQPQDILDILKLTGNKVTKDGEIITIYEDDEVTVWKQFDLTDGGRVEV